MSSKEITESPANSEPRDPGGFSPKGPAAKSSRARQIWSSRPAITAAVLGGLALSSAAYYRVRELVAALILFSFFFGVVMIAVLILWLIEQAASEAADRIETRIAHVPARRPVASARSHTGHALWRMPWN